MNKKQLIYFFSEFWGVNESEITDDLKLDSKELDLDSLKFYQFIAALESNFNVKVENIGELDTFESLYNNIKTLK